MYDLERESHMKLGKESNFELTLHVGQATLHPEASVPNTALQIFYVFCNSMGVPGRGFCPLGRVISPNIPC